VVSGRVVRFFGCKRLMFDRYYNQLMRFIFSMDMREWALALGAMILLGVVFLRGFGSRKSY
jgi:hypothetical protein